MLKELKNHTFGVIGSGSFATAIVKILCENVDTLYWSVRNKYTEEYINDNYHNPNYLTSIEFDLDQLIVSSDANMVAKNCDVLIFAVPSIYLLDTLKQIEIDLTDKIIVSVIKGIIPDFNDIVGHYFHKELSIPYENFVVITGPCHAEEISMERLSYLTVASISEKNANLLSDAIKTKYVKTVISDDIFGTEYSAVLKNIFALSAGIAHGLGYGDNFQAVLMSNAIREMERFLKEIYPLKRDIKNSAYLGDLLVTGYSYFSRNRMLGNMIGKGYTVKVAILEMNMIAEGYYATKGIYKIIQEHNINMPIVSAVYRMLYENENPRRCMQKLADSMD
ncbi:MAG: NAD(P)-binding domain-containing protein [Flavobacteriales bacterium]|nr:NAD(P)-binding domain-containing protein [Flavobacteriales bacterium]